MSKTYWRKPREFMSVIYDYDEVSMRIVFYNICLSHCINEYKCIKITIGNIRNYT